MSARTKKLKNVILTAKRNRLHHTKVNQELYINYNTAFMSERITKACKQAEKPQRITTRTASPSTRTIQ